MDKSDSLREIFRRRWSRDVEGGRRGDERRTTRGDKNVSKDEYKTRRQLHRGEEKEKGQVASFSSSMRADSKSPDSYILRMAPMHFTPSPILEMSPQQHSVLSVEEGVGTGHLGGQGQGRGMWHGPMADCGQPCLPSRPGPSASGGVCPGVVEVDVDRRVESGRGRFRL